MAFNIQAINTLANTTAAIQSRDEFVRTLERILGQRYAENPLTTYHIYGSEDIVSIDYAGVDIVMSTEDSGSYADSIRSAFEAIGEVFGIAFTEVSDPSRSLFDVGRLEDESSRIEYYYDPRIPDDDPLQTLGMSAPYANDSDQIWRLMTWRESEFEDPNAVELDTISTIWHELGHTLGLTHPGNNGFNKDFNQLDTVMSYVVTEPPNPYYTDADRAALNEISAKLSLGATGKTPLQIDKSNVYSYDEASQKILRNLKGSADEADFITGSKGTPESDVFIAGDADDRIKAGGGVDLIKAGDGDDLINGGNNVDQIFTGKGRDTVKIKNKPNLTGFDSIVDFSDYDIIKLVGFQPKGLRLEHYDDNTLLMHYNDVIAAVGYDINFADHVQVVR